MDNIFSKVVKPWATEDAKCMRSLCRSALQTSKMCSAQEMKKCISFIDPGQTADFASSAACSSNHRGAHPMVAQQLISPVAIAYLLVPSSAAQAEKEFSLLGHIQTSDRLNMSGNCLETPPSTTCKNPLRPKFVRFTVGACSNSSSTQCLSSRAVTPHFWCLYKDIRWVFLPGR